MRNGKPGPLSAMARGGAAGMPGAMGAGGLGALDPAMMATPPSGFDPAMMASMMAMDPSGMGLMGGAAGLSMMAMMGNPMMAAAMGMDRRRPRRPGMPALGAGLPGAMGGAGPAAPMHAEAPGETRICFSFLNKGGATAPARAVSHLISTIPRSWTGSRVAVVFEHGFRGIMNASCACKVVRAMSRNLAQNRCDVAVATRRVAPAAAVASVSFRR